MKSNHCYQLPVFIVIICAVLLALIYAKRAYSHDPIADMAARITTLESLPAGDNSAALEELRSMIEDLEYDLRRMTFLQEQITANRATIESVRNTNSAGVERTTAIPPIRLHGLPPGALMPSNPVMKQVNFIDVEFTIEKFVDGQHMALLSRDESGQSKPGHFSLFVAADRRVGLRSQDIKGGPNTLNLRGQQQLEAGTPHRIQVVIGPTRTVLFLDGLEIGATDKVNAWDGNDLPLIVGAACWGLSQAECVSSPTKRTNKFVGVVSADLYASRKVFLIQ